MNALFSAHSVNSRGRQKSKCRIWCRSCGIWSHSSSSNCTQSCTRVSEQTQSWRHVARRICSQRLRAHDASCVDAVILPNWGVQFYRWALRILQWTSNRRGVVTVAVGAVWRIRETPYRLRARDHECRERALTPAISSLGFHIRFELPECMRLQLEFRVW